MANVKKAKKAPANKAEAPKRTPLERQLLAVIRDCSANAWCALSMDIADKNGKTTITYQKPEGAHSFADFQNGLKNPDAFCHSVTMEV